MQNKAENLLKKCYNFKTIYKVTVGTVSKCHLSLAPNQYVCSFIVYREDEKDRVSIELYLHQPSVPWVPGQTGLLRVVLLPQYLPPAWFTGMFCHFQFHMEFVVSINYNSYFLFHSALHPREGFVLFNTCPTCTVFFFFQMPSLIKKKISILIE